MASLQTVSRETNLLEVGHPFPKSVQVEVVADVVFVYLNEEFVAL